LAHLRLQLLLRNLGVDIQIDYTKENFEELAEKSDVVYSRSDFEIDLNYIDLHEVSLVMNYTILTLSI